MQQTNQLRRDLIAGALSLAGIAAVVAVLRVLLGVTNPTTSALTLLLVVLATATASRLTVAIMTSIAAMLAFNFFFLPPVHTLSISEPHNWVALFVFLAVAAIASTLSSAARERAQEAERRRLEVDRLFDLSRDILLMTDSEGALVALTRHVARRFELDAVAICLPATIGWDVHQGGEREVSPPRELLDRTLARLRGELEYDARERAYGGHVRVPRPRAANRSRSYHCASARVLWGCWRRMRRHWRSGPSTRSEAWSRLPSSGRISCASGRRPKRSASARILRQRSWLHSVTTCARR